MYQGGPIRYWMGKIILVRHTIRETTDESDCSISDAGIELINKRCAEMLNQVALDNFIIVTSPFKRTIETAMCISSCTKERSIIIDPLLHETILHEGMSNKLSKSTLQYINRTTPETWDDIKERCKQFLNKMALNKTMCGDVFAVTHGGVINVMLEIVDPSYRFDRNEKDPNKYIPRYMDYAILELASDDKWRVLYRNF